MSRERDWNKLTDEELVTHWRGAGAGEPHPAAAELLGRYRVRVYRWCRSYVHDHDLALDLAQDVMVRVFEGIGALRGRFGPWIFMVVRNCCLGEIRKLQVRAGEAVDPDTLPHGGRDPEQAWLEQMAEDRFLALLTSVLDPVEQEAISLRCFEKMPVDLITGALGIATGSGARGVLQSARRKLRAALAGDDESEQGDVAS